MISVIYFTKILCLYKSCNSLKYPFFISLSPADFIQLLYTLRYFLYVALVIVFLLFASSNISRNFCIPILLGLISVGDGASSSSCLYAPSFNTNTMTGGYTLDVSNSALVREDLMINRDLKFLNNDTFINRKTNATDAETSLDIVNSKSNATIRLITGTQADTDTDVHVECNKTNNQTRFFKETRFDSDCFTYANTMTVRSNGMDILRPSGDSFLL